MALWVGRIRNPQCLSNVAAYKIGDDQLELSGRISTDNVTEAKTVLEQLHGHWTNPGHRDFPIRFDADPNIDGIYTADPGQGFSGDIGPGDLERGWFPIRLRARRACANWQQPVVTVYTAGANRTGKPGGVTALPWVAWPKRALAFWSENDTWSAYDRVGANPTTDERTVRWVTSSSLTNRASKMLLPVEYWYDMAATITRNGVTQTGLSTFRGGTIALSNGLITITVDPAGTHFADLTANPTGVAKSLALDVGYKNGGTWESVYAPDTYEILENTPERVAVRFVCSTLPFAASLQAMAWEVSLTRGAWTVDINAVGPGSRKWGIGATTALLTTAFVTNEGIYNADWVALCNATMNMTDLAAGRFYLNTAYISAQMGIGHIPSGSYPDRGPDLRDQWFSAQGVHQAIGSM